MQILFRLSQKKASIATIPVGRYPIGLTLVVLEGTSYVYCSNQEDNTLTVINANNLVLEPGNLKKAVVGTIRVGANPGALTAVVVNGKAYVYCGNYQDETVSVIDPKGDGSNPKIIQTISLNHKLYNLITVNPVRFSTVPNSSAIKALIQSGFFGGS